MTRRQKTRLIDIFIDRATHRDARADLVGYDYINEQAFDYAIATLRKARETVEDDPALQEARQ